MNVWMAGQEVEFVKLLDERLQGVRKVVLTSHRNPDDDSISSLLGLYHHLVAHYSDIDFVMAYSGEATDRWSYFKGFENIKFGTDPGLITDCDLVIMTDACLWSRVSESEVAPDELQGKVVAIDHHKNAPDEGVVAFIDSGASSCSELIYRLFYTKVGLDKRIAEVMMLGILGDTGSFTFVKPGQAGVFAIAQRLVSEGEVDIQAMKAHYMGYSEAVYRMLATIMGRTTIVNDERWGKYSFSYITKDEALKFTKSDLEVNAAAAGLYSNQYTKSIFGVKWGFVLYPSLYQDQYNLSSRSLPNGVNLRMLFSDLVNGGGHDLAAGGKFVGARSAEEVIEKVQSFLKKHEPQKYLLS